MVAQNGSCAKLKTVSSSLWSSLSLSSSISHEGRGNGSVSVAVVTSKLDPMFGSQFVAAAVSPTVAEASSSRNVDKRLSNSDSSLDSISSNSIDTLSDSDSSLDSISSNSIGTAVSYGGGVDVVG